LEGAFGLSEALGVWKYYLVKKNIFLFGGMPRGLNRFIKEMNRVK